MSVSNDIKGELNEAIASETKMNAVRLRRYINCNPIIHALTPDSMVVFDEIFELLAQIKPLSSDNYRKLWVKVPRGTVADCGFDNLDEAKEYFGAKTIKQLNKKFLLSYPKEHYWFKIRSASYKENKILQVDGFTISIEPRRKGVFDDLAYEYKKLLEWVKEAIKEVIRKCKEGTYNKEVVQELPYTLQYGVIAKKILWEHHPEYREMNLHDLTQDEIDSFIEIVKKTSETPIERIPDMTFNKYFEFASLAFRNAGLLIEGMSPFEQFNRHGEDFGNSRFRDVDLDSPEAFLRYFNGEGQMGGHPWGLRMGSSRSRIMLRPWLDERGYHFTFSGNPNWNVYEMVKMYPPLVKAGLPVRFTMPDETISYLREEENVGFVAEDDLRAYCQNHFGETINDFYHFNPEEDEPLLQHIKWNPLNEITLIEV